MRALPFSLLLASAIGVAAPGCGGAAAAGSPEQALEAFADSVEDERYDDAYALMSEGYRQRVSREEFARHMRANPDEARKLAEAIADADGPLLVSARIHPGEGDPVRLVRDEGDWRLRGNVVAFYDQSSPRATLRSFVRAMEERRYDVIMRFVPNADREGMTEEQMREAWEGEGREEIERLLANLRANLDNPIEVVGDRATMPYGERFSVQFLREDGVWKIEDPD